MRKESIESEIDRKQRASSSRLASCCQSSLRDCFCFCCCHYWKWVMIKMDVEDTRETLKKEGRIRRAAVTNKKNELILSARFFSGLCSSIFIKLSHSYLILFVLLLFDATHNRLFIDHIYPKRLPFMNVFHSVIVSCSYFLCFIEYLSFSDVCPINLSFSSPLFIDS